MIVLSDSRRQVCGVAFKRRTLWVLLGNKIQFINTYKVEIL